MLIINSLFRECRHSTSNHWTSDYDNRIIVLVSMALAGSVGSFYKRYLHTYVLPSNALSWQLDGDTWKKFMAVLRVWTQLSNRQFNYTNLLKEYLYTDKTLTTKWITSIKILKIDWLSGAGLSSNKLKMINRNYSPRERNWLQLSQYGVISAQYDAPDVNRITCC